MSFLRFFWLKKRSHIKGKRENKMGKGNEWIQPF